MTLLAPGARTVRGRWPSKPITGTAELTSPYLDRPLVPLAVALPQMLEKIEAELVDNNKTVGATEKSRLRHRAELMRELLKAR